MLLYLTRRARSQPASWSGGVGLRQGGAAPAELLLAAASAEKYSNHPTAKAGLSFLAMEANVPLHEPKDFSESAGRGVSATVDGAKVLVGRAQWLREQGVKEDFEKSVDLNETEGFSLIFVARNGKCIGWLGLQDQTRAEAKEALADLKAAGVRRVAMISGDRQAVATRVARGRSDAKRFLGRVPAAEQRWIMFDRPRPKDIGWRWWRWRKRRPRPWRRAIWELRWGRPGAGSGDPFGDDCADEQ